MLRKIIKREQICANISGRNVGVWGIGITGKTTIRFLSNAGCTLSAMDKRQLTHDELIFLRQHNVSFFHEENLGQFFKKNDYVIISPGIFHPACLAYKDKILSELDLFNSVYKKPIIAVTGSVGKTSTVYLLNQILNTAMNVQAGGNIGTGMLDLISKQDKYDLALLELSSFQLNHSLQFSPDLAIWTNFYPNHLDRHGSQDNYFQAKATIVNNQKTSQLALLPLSLFKRLMPLNHSDANWYFMSVAKPSPDISKELYESCSGIFCVKEHHIVLHRHDKVIPLIPLKDLPPITFIENWVTICATLYLLHVPCHIIKDSVPKLSLPKHRLEKIATIGNIDFYNDSKSTTPAATKAAIQLLSARPIILLLGGISKGIDRNELIQYLNSSIKLVVCFGKERTDLIRLCQQHNRQCASFNYLNNAFDYCFKNAAPGDQIVLSPAGASFDQFENYQDRGNYFKYLIHKLQKDDKIRSFSSIV